MQASAYSINSVDIVDRIVAVVNDDIITLFELNEKVKPFENKIKTLGYGPYKEKETLFKVRQEILNQLIEEKLTDQEIKKNDINVSDEEVNQAIERFKANNFLTDETFRKALKDEGMTYGSYREQLKKNLLRTKLVTYEVKSKIIITKEDILAYYNDHIDQYRGKTKYHLRNIILRLPQMATSQDKQKIRDKMEEISHSIDQGESFAKLARQFSESSLAKDGGDLGFFALDELSPEIRDAIAGLNGKQHSKVVETEQGYQIFYVDEIKKQSDVPLENVSNEIEEKLYQNIVNEKFKTWIEALRSRSHIKIIN